MKKIEIRNLLDKQIEFFMLIDGESVTITLAPYARIIANTFQETMATKVLTRKQLISIKEVEVPEDCEVFDPKHFEKTEDLVQKAEADNLIKHDLLKHIKEVTEQVKSIEPEKIEEIVKEEFVKIKLPKPTKDYDSKFGKKKKKVSEKTKERLRNLSKKNNSKEQS